MTLKEFLKENDLLKYLEHFPSAQSALNRIKIDTYEGIENGFVFNSGKNRYKVIIKKSAYGDSFVYEGEKVVVKWNYSVYEHIPCFTRAEENSYPKSVAWIGTALTQRENSLLSIV